MTRSVIIAAAAIAVVGVATTPAMALPAYLGNFGAVRDALPAAAPVFVYTFDQHECSETPTFENKITTSRVKSLKLNGRAKINATCRTGVGGFENTPIQPGFNATNSEFVWGDYLITPQFTPGIVSDSSTFEMWIEIDNTTLVNGTNHQIVNMGKCESQRMRKYDFY
jgi:hypothetical protein